MNRKVILSVLMVLAVVMIAIVVIDRLKSRVDNRPDNPYEYSVDQYKAVDSTLVRYAETLDFTFGDFDLRGIAFANNRLYLVEDNYLLIVSPEGEKLSKSELPESPKCITASSAGIFIGFKNYISHYSTVGTLIRQWKPLNDSALLTSLAVTDSLLFAADAGNRRVLRYTTGGILSGSFDGKRDNSLHGFILPSPYFDLAVNNDGELWVVNPGRHALENYSFSGELRGFWDRTAITIDGFSGCCNPAQMAVMPDGSFVTAEKGMVRIKIHGSSGELISVVAAPEKFEGETEAPDLAVNPAGDIYVLDFERKMIRVFQIKK